MPAEGRPGPRPEQRPAALECVARSARKPAAPGRTRAIRFSIACALLLALAIAWAGTHGSGRAQEVPPAEALGVLAYGGYAALAPENTLAAIRAAAEAGLPDLWLDVRTSSDGQLMLLRDATLDRTTDCSGPVAEQPAGNIGRCDAGAWFDPAFAGEPVPRLDAALAQPGRMVLMLHQAASPAVLDVIAAAGAAERVTLASAEDAVLADLAQRAPGIPRWKRASALDAETLLLARDLDLDGVAVDPEGLDVEIALALRAMGLQVAAVAPANGAALLAARERRADRFVVERAEPMVWLLGMRFLTYPAEAFGLPTRARQAFAAALASGDLNADGRRDLVLGAPGESGTVADGGWLGISRGAAAFPGPVRAEPGAEAEGRYGSVLALADFDADGFEDLAIGYPGRDFDGMDSGVVHLWNGSAAGPAPGSRPIGPEPTGGAQVGAALATGDFNGDGLPDLAVAAPAEAVAGQPQAGRVRLLPGRSDAGPVATGRLEIDRALEALGGEAVAREGFGAALAMGDLDGDGFEDLAIGSPGTDVGGLTDAGSLTILRGGPDDPDGDLAPAAVEELRPGLAGLPGAPERGARFGAALAAADFDGDGFEDLAVGLSDAAVAGRVSAGAVLVIYSGPITTTALIHQDTPGLPGEIAARDQFGARLSAGDFDGDGRPDLLVSSPGEGGPRLADMGSVTLIPSGPDGLRPRAALALSPELPLGVPPALRLGFGQAHAIDDLNGDGAADLALGVPAMDIGGAAQAGALLVAWGYHPERPGVPTASATPAAPGSATPSASPGATSPATPTGPIPTATQTAPTPTARPGRVHLPYVVRLRILSDRYPTPLPPLGRP